MKLNFLGYLLIVLFFILVSCINQSPLLLEIPVSTTTSSPLFTATSTYVAITPSPLPTQPIIHAMTPDLVQVEKWREYEKALALKLLPPNPLRGEVLCEWEILGEFDYEVYVWALCQSPPYTADLPPSVASVPAVIYLEPDGSVREVQKPGSGSAYANDIRRLFPPDVQDMIFSHSTDTNRMEAHINLRREKPEPPLIILSAFPAVTPIP